MPVELRKKLLYYGYRLLAIIIPAAFLYYQTIREAKIKADAVKAKAQMGYETLAKTVNELKEAREADIKEYNEGRKALAELQGYCKAIGELHHRRDVRDAHGAGSIPAALPPAPVPQPPAAMKPRVQSVPVKFDAF